MWLILTLSSFSQTAKEIAAFEEMMYEVKEYSDTTLNSNNEIVRKEGGWLFGWEDICQDEVLLVNDNGSVKELRRVSESLSFPII